MSFADVERKQIEQLERILHARDGELLRRGRAAVRRDDQGGARGRGNAPLARARPCGAGVHARGGDGRSAERLAQVGDAGAQRLEQRLGPGPKPDSRRQQSEATREFETGVAQAEHELRRRLDGLAADAEAERAVLEARLRELARRIDETLART